MSQRYQRVILSGQNFNYNKIKLEFLKGQYWGINFLVYIKDLFSEFRCLGKRFTDDTTLFSVPEHAIKTATKLNKDPDNIGKWVRQLEEIL